MDCSGIGLDNIPPVFPPPGDLKSPMCILDLHRNNIETVENNTFCHNESLFRSMRFLYLSNNNISFLHKNAFSCLSNLTYLNLSENSLSWTGDDHGSFAKGVFKPLKNLRVINLKENNISTFEGFDEELKYLKSLEMLFINGCQMCKFGKQIKNLTKLRVLNFAGRTKESCRMEEVSDDLFENFNESRITNLSLSSCNIMFINSSALSPFNKSLVHLDISYNKHLKFGGMNVALAGLVNSTKLLALDVNRIHKQSERSTVLKVRHIENLRTLQNLTRLYMDGNKLELIEARILSGKLLPFSLAKLTLAGNRLVPGKYVEVFWKMSWLKELDLSRQHINYDPFYNHHFEQNENLQNISCSLTKPDQIFILPADIQHIKWSYSFLSFEVPSACVLNGENLLTLDFSSNFITALNGPIYGLESLTSADLSYNLCKNISKDFFSEFKSLKYLDLSYNQLGVSLASVDGHYVFRNLTKLEKLNLSNNKIFALHRDIFSGLAALKCLNLRSNNLDIWDIDLWSSKCLTVLDLSENKLDSLPKDLQQYLDTMTTSPCNNGSQIDLHMSHNPVQCTCHNIPLLKWMWHSRVHISFTKDDECRLKDGERLKLQEPADVTKLVTQLEHDCVDYGWLIGAGTSIIICIITTIVTLIMYRKRWKLRHMYYSRRRRHVHQGYLTLFTYDGFVSYSKQMAQFVKDIMVPALEQERGLKLWIGDRNSHPGASVAENIAHAIYNSRKSVHLLDKNYFNDSWCDYEINMANMESIESKRKCVIVVVLDTAVRETPLSIMRLLDREASLQYPTEGSAEEIDAFWTRLANIIVSE